MGRFPSFSFRLKQYNILMAEQKRIVISLSTVLDKSQEYYALQPKATFWFGAVLSFFDHNYDAELQDDLTPSQKVTLIRLITHSVASIAAFYEQEKPNSIFRLFSFMGRVFELNAACTEYAFVLSKVTYLNVLAIYSLKVGQYSYALEVYGHILDVFNLRLIDNTNEVFLTILSNFLSLLKRSGKKMTSKLIQVEGLLKELFFKYLTKLILIEKQSDSDTLLHVITLLAGIYRQHETLLSRYEKDFNSMVVHFYQQNMKSKRKMPQKMIEFVVKEKIRKSFVFGINLNQDQLKFYSSNRYKNTKQQKQKKEGEEDPEKRIKKMEVMLEQTIDMLQEQKMISTRTTIQRPILGHSVTLNRNNYSTINRNTIESVQIQPTMQTIDQTAEPRRIPQRIQPLTRSITKRREMVGRQPSKIVQKYGKIPKNIKFKIYSIFVDVYEDGVLLSDYTNENKRYIEWNTISLIIERLEAQFVFEDFLKIQAQNYFDIVRILAFYLTKNNNRQICLLGQPVPLLQVNSLVRLYKQEGKYLKLALMNQYNNSKYVGVVDLYLSQYSEFFKELSKNQYMVFLNDRISSRVSENQFERDSFYNLDYIKKKRETTVADLGKFLQVSCLESAIQERGFIYKCLLLLKNNTQVLVKIIDNIKTPIPEDFDIKVKIQSFQKYNQALYVDSASSGLKKLDKIDREISIPLKKVTSYFPLFDKSLKDYLALYSKMYVETLSVENFLGEVNLGGVTFEFKTHVLKTQMIPYGKYFSVVTAELVGSNERIWALVIKLYDLAYMNYKVTVLMNPYHDFLESVTRDTKQEQTPIMRNLLIGQSVKQTLNWLKQNNKFQSRMNLFEYLLANRLV